MPSLGYSLKAIFPVITERLYIEIQQYLKIKKAIFPVQYG